MIFTDLAQLFVECWGNFVRTEIFNSLVQLLQVVPDGRAALDGSHRLVELLPGVLSVVVRQPRSVSEILDDELLGAAGAARLGTYNGRGGRRGPACPGREPRHPEGADRASSPGGGGGSKRRPRPSSARARRHPGPGRTLPRTLFLRNPRAGEAGLGGAQVRTDRRPEVRRTQPRAQAPPTPTFRGGSGHGAHHHQPVPAAGL